MGNRIHTPPRGRPGARRRVAAAIALVLMSGPLSALGAVSARADTAPLAPAGSEAAASATAQASGTAVGVDADTTSTSTTVANPDGSFTYTGGVVPVRVKQAGTWVPVDATLQRNADGTLAPKAVEPPVVFGGGGTAPLATETNSSGQQVAISWPHPLTAPALSGATATYPDVYPGVDLAMTATVDGGYTEQLLIKTAAAAANPALADIHFDTSTSGLTLSRNSAGGLQAADAAGTVVFTSPTATMWSTPPAAAAAVAAARANGTGKAVARSLAAQSAGTGDTSQEDTGPVTALGMSVSANGLDLIPPAGALQSSTLTYPVVIDPSLSPPDNANGGWTWIASNDSGTSYWKGGNNFHDSDAHVGYDDWCSDGSSGCTEFGKTRALFSVNLDPLAGKNVTGATFSFTEQGPTSSISGSRQLDLYGFGAYSAASTWSNTDAPSGTAYPGSFASINGTTTGSGNFIISKLIKDAVDNNKASQNIMLAADNESDDTAYRYLQGNPQLEVDYWSTPSVPTSVATVEGGSSKACSTTAPGTWISKSDSSGGTLNAKITSAATDIGYSEYAHFYSHRDLPSAGSVVDSVSGSITTQAAAQPVAVDMPALSDGQEYDWRVTAENTGGYTSDYAPGSSNYCWFSVDFTAPTITAGTPSPPTSLTGSTSTGSLPVTTADGGTHPSGVDHIVYNMNGTSLTSGGDGAKNTTAASIPLTAEHWGTNTVWYSVFDKAGNQSTPAHYDFYIPDSAYTPGTAGDLGNDGIPDLAAVDRSGNLRGYNDPLIKDPDQAANQSTLIPAGNAPNGKGFTGALVTHAGSFVGQNCDDMIVIQYGTAGIETNQNCAPTASTTWTPIVPVYRPGTVTGDASNYNTSDWSDVQQAVALPQSAATFNKPALVTVENTHGVENLWLFTDRSGAARFTDATLLATGSSWTGLTLLSPGSIGGNPALWTRDPNSGALRQYLNITAMTPSTANGTPIAASGYASATYPMLIANPSVGTTGTVPAGSTNGPALWAVDTQGTLQLITTTLDAANTATFQAPVAMSAPGWGSALQSLGSPAGPFGLAGYHQAVTATRILDTRSNLTHVVGGTLTAGPSTVTGGSTTVLQISGDTITPAVAGDRTTIPSSVTAVAIDVTVAGETDNGFLTAFADGTPRPATSSTSYTAATTMTGYQIVPVGADGRIDLYSSATATTALIADVTGYFTSDPNQPHDQTYTPLPTSTVALDTRTAAGILHSSLRAVGTVADSTSFTLQVTGNSGVPANATAVAANLTTTGETGNGFLEAYATGAAPTLLTSLSYSASTSLASMAADIPLGSDGSLTILNTGSPADIVVSISGYYTTGTIGQTYHAVNAIRLVDTRDGTGGTHAAPLPALGTYTLTTADTQQVTTTGATLATTLTIANAAAGGFAIAYPSDQTLPANSSNLNWQTATTASNLALTPTSSTGQISIYNGGSGSIDLIVDCSGYFA